MSAAEPIPIELPDLQFETQSFEEQWREMVAGQKLPKWIAWTMVCIEMEHPNDGGEEANIKYWKKRLSCSGGKESLLVWATFADLWNKQYSMYPDPFTCLARWWGKHALQMILLSNREKLVEGHEYDYREYLKHLVENSRDSFIRHVNMAAYRRWLYPSREA